MDSTSTQEAKTHVDWTLLAKKSQEGDADAYRQFLTALYPIVEAMIQRRFGSAVDVQKMVEDCLLGVKDLLATFQEEADMKSWLHSIVEYQVSSFLKKLDKKERFKIYMQIMLSSSDQSGESSSLSKEIQSRVIEVYQRLPIGLKDAVKWIKFEKISIKEAAIKAKVKPAEMEERLQKAMQLIQKWLKLDLENDAFD